MPNAKLFVILGEPHVLDARLILEAPDRYDGVARVTLEFEVESIDQLALCCRAVLDVLERPIGDR